MNMTLVPAATGDLPQFDYESQYLEEYVIRTAELYANRGNTLREVHVWPEAYDVCALRMGRDPKEVGDTMTMATPSGVVLVKKVGEGG